MIQTMSPTTDAHENALDEPLVKSLVGPEKHLSTYEVPVLERPNCAAIPDKRVSFGNFTNRNASCANPTMITGSAQSSTQAQDDRSTR